MSPVGSNMRAGSTVLSTNEVSTTRLDTGGDEVWPALVPLLLLLLLLQAPRPMVTAMTQPAASHWLSRMGFPLIVARRPPLPQDGRRIGKRSHRFNPQVKDIRSRFRHLYVSVKACRRPLICPLLRKRSHREEARLRGGGTVRELDELAERFWSWRACQQPRTRDDIPRLDRPAGWRPEVDPDLADRRRSELGAFQADLARIRPDEVPDRVDQRLLRSAMARVTWESDVLRIRSIPRFWIDQAIGPIFDVLLRPGVDAARIAEVVRLLRAVPITLSYAPDALRRPAREFAELAITETEGMGERIAACAQALARIDPGAAADLGSAAAQAGAALEGFGGWLTARLADLPPAIPVGRPRYEWFLREVACVPLTVDEIRDIGRREYERAVWLELL